MVRLAFSRMARAIMEHTAKSASSVKDPVCGMNVEPFTAKHKLDHAGKTYYFCCAPCLEKFRARPSDYLGPRPAAAAGLHVINIMAGATKGAAVKDFHAPPAPAAPPR